MRTDAQVASTSLVNYDAARSALQKAHRVDEVKAIRDKAEAIRVYARQANDTEMQNWAVEIKLRAERRAGELIKEQQAAQLLASRGQPKKSADVSRLSDVGISHHQSARWQKLAAVPERKFEKIIAEAKEKTGELTSAAVLRATCRAEAETNLNSIEALQAKELAGLYDCVVIDPPWRLDMIERDTRPEQVSWGYPVMDVAQIASEVGAHLAEHLAENAHVFLWTTQRYLPISFGLIEEWNLAYGETFTWHKNGGFQPFGGPQYNSEFVIHARKGSPVFLSTKDFLTCFNAPRGRHSEKPGTFYETLCRVTGGRRLDMYGRRTIPGFDAWGKEAPHVVQQ